MYSRLDQGAEVMCTSNSLPTLFRNASGYHRQLALTPTGVVTEEIADDPALTQAIRAHAREVTGFVQDRMPAMMRGMMGCGMMGPGMMAPHQTLKCAVGIDEQRGWSTRSRVLLAIYFR